MRELLVARIKVRPPSTNAAKGILLDYLITKSGYCMVKIRVRLHIKNRNSHHASHAEATDAHESSGRLPIAKVSD